MTVARLCPKCNSELPSDAPEGLCPKCLLHSGLQSSHGTPPGAEQVSTGAPHGSLAAPTPAELALHFPQLEILELIGRGGMGAVYKARQPSLDRLVAVKVLPREGGRDPAFAERFAREARALARLGHPNIVAIYDFGQAGDFYYFVMEYVDGANLRQVLRDGHLRPEQALRIVPQICDALQYAHEEGVVHRDIKPENILLNRKGRVRIADFGLAKLLGRDTGNFTLTGSRQVMGTLYYMAPEQVERPLEVDHRADIYSLGVVFYELLTGQLPVGHFPMPSEKAGTDAFLDEVVLRAMEREPERRYQRASDVKTDVEAPAHRATLPAPRTRADDMEVARHQLKGPANGLMVMGVLGPLGWLIALLIYALVLYVDRGGYMPQIRFDLRNYYGPFVTFSLLNAIAGGFLIVGARKMKRLDAYELSVITSLSVVLQIATPTFPISFIVGGWSFWVLRKPEVRAAFADELRRRARAPAAEEPPPRTDSARAAGVASLNVIRQARPAQAEPEKSSPPVIRVRWPALGLLLVGVLHTAILPVSVLLGWLQLTQSPTWYRSAALPLVLSVSLGALIIAGAVGMLRLRSHGLATIAAILALLPCGPAWPIGLPVGIWALFVLAAPDVKAAFGRRER